MVAPIVTTNGRLCIAMGKGVQGGTAGQACTFQVQCKDTTGENRTTGGDIVVAKLLPPPEKGHVVDCHVIDNADGTYTCTYLPTKALRGVDLMVSVNGTNLAGTPFKASFDAGRAEASNCRAYGRQLHHGTAGKPLAFHVLARDAYCNQRLSGRNEFKVHVQALSAHNAEYAQYIKKYSTEASLTDLGDGTYAVSWSTAFPGWYSVAVSLERVPICGSPFRVCVLSAVARLPAALAHQPCLLSERTEPRAMPPPVSAASCALVDDVLCVRRPLSRQPGERPPRHDVLHLFHSEQRTWAAHEIMGPALPARTALAGVDSVLFFFTHSGGPTAPIDGVFCADLDALRVSGEARRHRVHTSGEFPAAAEGYQVCTMRRGLGSATVWFLGGRDGQGRLLDDVHAYETGSATWSCAHSASRGARAPGEAPAAREGHSVVEFQQALWLFGGRAEGGCLADLHCLDAAGEAAEWRPAQPSGAPPAPRKQHSCVVLQPTGYMLVVGGVDDAERLLEDVAVLDLYGLSWSRLEAGRVARRGVFCGCVRGELLTFGGQEATGELSQQLGVLDLTTLLQRSCLEFKGNPAEYVSVRGQRPSLLSLRNAFTVEAWVLPRSFPPFATILSKAAPNWMTGFGLAKYGAGKGDLEEVNTVNFFLTPGYTTSKATAMIDAHVWSHVAGVYDGSSLKIYVNGALADSILTAKADKEEEIEALHVPKADLCIGAHPGKAAWDGMIDEVRVWNVARTDEQVRDAMAAPVPSNTPGLVGQWTFNEASGEVVVDSSGMRNHGAIEGALCRGVSMRMDRGMGSAAQQRIDDVAGAYAKWRLDFEQTHERAPSKADILLSGSAVIALARQLGHFD